MILYWRSCSVLTAKKSIGADRSSSRLLKLIAKPIVTGVMMISSDAPRVEEGVTQTKWQLMQKKLNV